MSSRASFDQAASDQLILVQEQQPHPRNSIDKKGKRRMSAEDNIDQNNNTSPSNGHDSRRSCEKERMRGPSAFSRLPKEIMQQILFFVSPNEFDSLTLINSSWYQASRSCLLYARQLSQCGVVVPKDIEDTPGNLISLVRQFGRASRRGLFESMLRPETTEIQLICRSLSSSAAVPGGEVFKYEFSPKGTHLVAISSSRMVVIDTATPSKDLPVTIKRELKILRRPISATILDDGTIMAVLSTEHKVNVYNLEEKKIKRVKSLDLDNAPRAIALAPDGTVLAVAYDGGVEVISLAPGFEQKRAVKCDLVDTLCFSLDGTVLIGSTLNSGSPATVVISAPYFSDVMAATESLVQMWTTQILFPTTSRDISHATLLTHHGDNSSWTFTYDKAFAAFRAVRVDDLRNGHTYFSTPNTSPLPPIMLPAPSADGGVVASGFSTNSVWIYGIPSDLENPVESTAEASGSNSRNSLMIGATFVPWQHSVERSRNNFVQGRFVGKVPGLVGLKFSMTSKGERLIAVAAGIKSEGHEEGPEPEILEGGRVILYNFARSPSKGERDVISIDVGDGSNAELEQLEEQQNDIEAEVNIVRRRTVAQRQRQSVHGPAPPVPPLPSVIPLTSHANSSSTSIATTPNISRQGTDVSHTEEEDEEGVSLSEAIEWSYSHTDTRSYTILQRAATAARANAERTPRRRPDAAPGPNFAVTNYRLLGLREEEWVEPPPPYVEKLTAIPLYDYEARLLERARSMGILNPNERVRRRSSGGELDIDRRERDPLASGASSPRLRRNVPSLRITSPVSPGGGGLSRNGSVSAGPSTTFQGFNFADASSTNIGTPPASSSGFTAEQRRPSTAQSLSRRNSIQREPPGGILSLSTINDTEVSHSPPSPQPSHRSMESQYSVPPPQSFAQPQRSTTPTMNQQVSSIQHHSRPRSRDPESMPQRVFFDERSPAIPPVPAIPTQYRSNSMPLEQNVTATPSLQQRAHTERPQSAMYSHPAPFAQQPNNSVTSLPNFDTSRPSRTTVSPRATRIPPQPSTPPATQAQFQTSSPSRPVSRPPQAQQSQQSQVSPQTPQQQGQLLLPLISRLPSHRYSRQSATPSSPALSIPSATSTSQPVTPITPLGLPATSATAPVTPAVPRNVTSNPQGMMPVSAMVAQPGPPPGSSGSTHSNSSVGHPQFRTAMAGGNHRNTLSLTVSPPPVQAATPAAPTTAPVQQATTSTTRGSGTQRSKSRGRRSQHGLPTGYVNPAFMTVPNAPPAHLKSHIHHLTPVSVHFLHQAVEPAVDLHFTAGFTHKEHQGCQAQVIHPAASMKKKKGWGRKGREKSAGAMMMENTRAAAMQHNNQHGGNVSAYAENNGRGRSQVAGGGGMDESFEVVRKGTGNENGIAEKASCSIM
ncbi:uncharacterized protein DFL_005327 [Arthrobotrys flagrans]|uniref:F-box domain-containing protein n=1 Tax=Arthrobotrys flagrans TaxID=97331 RepID=A0A437A839_ARTFL|nr:hypothetical protein DFL_005327 [Arthrobotrys flagrans]